MKLYVDDIREAPDESWTLCKNVTEAIRCIGFWKDDIIEISLDHDISNDVRINGTYRPFPSEETFAAVAYFIGATWGKRNFDYENDTPPQQPKITAHSANPIGCEAIEFILGTYGIGCDIKMMGEAHRVK